MTLRQAQGERKSLTAPLWRWTGGNGTGWFFISITGDAAETIAASAFMHRLESGRAKGFGSVKVVAAIGGSRWATSVFPVKEGGYLLPVKASVRKAEDIGEGDPVEVTLEF